MINNDYNIENFTNPNSTYNRLSDKIKIGQLIYNVQNKNIEKVSLEILKEIIEYEKNGKGEQHFFLLGLNDKWLTEIFDFNSQFVNIQNMTVFTSRKHNLKIHKVHDYRIGYTLRENSGSGNFKGKHHFKPLINTVNELMDHLYLIKREMFDFSKYDMKYINEVISLE